MKLLPTLLETLLRCQQPRRRPHLEAAKPKQAGANWSSLHLDFSPGPTCPSPSYTPDPFLLHILSGLSWLSVPLPPPHHCLSHARKPPLAPQCPHNRTHTPLPGLLEFALETSPALSLLIRGPSPTGSLGSGSSHRCSLSPQDLFRCSIGFAPYALRVFTHSFFKMYFY